jgi:pullulanase
VFDATGKGYINGAYTGNTSKVQFGIKGGAVSGTGWRVNNAAVINYMSAHDNNTLWDKLAISNPDNTVEERMAMNRLGAAILMISQGTPFWQAGEEMLRSKPDASHSTGFNENSYNAGDAVNNIDWDVLSESSDEYAMMLYYKGLIEMREAYEIFRSSDSSIITFGKLNYGGMTVTYTDANGNQALVLINPTAAPEAYKLDSEWKMVADGIQAGSKVIGTESGSVVVDAYSVLVFVK